MQKSHVFPKDSSVKILTSGLLGEQYLGVTPGADEKNLAAGDTVFQTQSAVVLENLIGQFINSKAAEAGSTGAQPGRPARGAGNDPIDHDDVAAAPAAVAGRCGAARRRAGARRHARRLHHAACRARPGRAARPVGELEPQGVRLQREARRARAQAGRHRLCQGGAAAGARVDRQLLRQLRRCLVGHQQPAAGQGRGGRARFRALHHQHAVRRVRPVRPGQRGRPRPSVRGFRPDARPLGRRCRRLHRAAAARTVDGARDGGAAARPVGVAGAGDSAAGRARSRSTSLRVVNTRANLLNASRVLDEIALDKYTFVRDAYLQRRRSLVYDGDAPPPAEQPRRGDDAPAAPAGRGSAAGAPARRPRPSRRRRRSLRAESAPGRPPGARIRRLSR